MGEVAVVEVACRATEGYQLLAEHQCLAALEGEHLLHQRVVGQHMAGNHQVSASCDERELFLQVGGGKERVGHLLVANSGLPLAGDGGDAAAQHGGGACVGEGQQVAAHLVVVEEYYVAHSVCVL